MLWLWRNLPPTSLLHPRLRCTYLLSLYSAPAPSVDSMPAWCLYAASSTTLHLSAPAASASHLASLLVLLCSSSSQGPESDYATHKTGVSAVREGMYDKVKVKHVCVRACVCVRAGVHVCMHSPKQCMGPPCKPLHSIQPSVVCGCNLGDVAFSPCLTPSP